MEKKIIIIIGVLLVGGGYSYYSKTSQEKEIPRIEISVEGTNKIIEPNYYPEGFDFNYEELPVIQTSELENLLNVKLIESNLDKLTIGEDYYNVLEDNRGVIERETYNLDKTNSNDFKFQVKRRGNFDENAVYYILLNESDSDVFVFQVDFVLDENLDENLDEDLDEDLDKN